MLRDAQLQSTIHPSPRLPFNRPRPTSCNSKYQNSIPASRLRASGSLGVCRNRNVELCECTHLLLLSARVSWALRGFVMQLLCVLAMQAKQQRVHRSSRTNLCEPPVHHRCIMIICCCKEISGSNCFKHIETTPFSHFLTCTSGHAVSQPHPTEPIPAAQSAASSGSAHAVFHPQV